MFPRMHNCFFTTVSWYTLESMKFKTLPCSFALITVQCYCNLATERVWGFIANITSRCDCTNVEQTTNLCIWYMLSDVWYTYTNIAHVYKTTAFFSLPESIKLSLPLRLHGHFSINHSLYLPHSHCQVLSFIVSFMFNSFLHSVLTISWSESGTCLKQTTSKKLKLKYI